ncbi:MAG: hypothetical protein M1816_006758 [Peltula sp. TS41687]|nr:MAG: hypothetical protein M1816_006758 [Peltula sp. TS41687]
MSRMVITVTPHHPLSEKLKKYAQRPDQPSTAKRTNSDTPEDDAQKPHGLRQKLVAAFSKLLLRRLKSRSQKRNEDEEVKEEEPPTLNHDPFGALPIEIQLKIVCNLSFDDILYLRQACKAVNQMIMTNEQTIVRDQILTKVPPYIIKLYPPLGRMKLRFLAGLAHRQMVCKQLAELVADHIEKELLRLRTPRARKEFEPRKQRIRKKMVPMLFTLFHHFELFRSVYVEHLVSHDTPMQPTDWERETLRLYSSQDLLRAHMMYEFLCQCFALRLRPPTYAGRLERYFRGWHEHVEISNDSVAKLIVIGGLREMARIWQIEDFNERLYKLEAWVVGLYSRANGSVRGIRYMYNSYARSLMTRMDWWHEEPYLTIPPRQDLPMPILNREALDYILAHLPPLWTIWYPAAERELIDRRVLRFIEDTPDQTQFLLELMRTDDEQVESDSEMDGLLDQRMRERDPDAEVLLLDEMWRIWMPPSRYDDWP